MQCNCGGQSDYIHKVVRKGEVMCTFQKCPACGRVLILTGHDWVTEERKRALDEMAELNQASGQYD